MSLHINTPRMSVSDPRGLPVRTVEYCRTIKGGPVEPRINRVLHDPAGRVIRQWDPRLWELQSADPLTPASLTQVFSLNARVIRTDSADAGTQRELPGLGSQSVLGWDSRQTRRETEHDALLRPVAVCEQGAGEPRHCVERFTYGSPGAGDQAKNQFGQLIRHDHPGGRVLFNAFAISGQCSEDTRHFTLDPVTPDWPEREEDRLALLEPGAGATTRWRFGAQGDVLEQVDARDNRHVFALTVDGRLRERRLQLKNQPEQTLVSDIRYSAYGSIERETAGNGVVAMLTYRPEDGRLTVRRDEDATGRVLQHRMYGYDRMGNVLSIEDKAMPIRYFANQRIEPVSRFFYDSLYQLIRAFGWEAGTASQGPPSRGRVDPAAVSNYQQSYRYDASGNLCELIHLGSQGPGRNLQPARYSNRSLPYDVTPPTEAEIAAAFDDGGNLLMLEPGRLLSWNLRNQLQSVSPVERVSGGNDQEVYLYGNDAQRVRKIRSQKTSARTVVAEVRYVPGLELRSNSGTGERLQVITVEGGLNSARVLHWESAPPSGINDRYRYSCADHVGSVSLETAADGAIISQERFHPFGTTAWQDGEHGYKFARYSGKERDATRLCYYGSRYYIPWLQHWLNPDPAGAVDGLNLYRMVLNNPMTYSDVDGAETREKQANGLWTPVLATGENRQRPGAVPVDAGKPHNNVPFTAKATGIREALTIPQFSRLTINTDLFMPQKAGYSQTITKQLVNTQGGDRFIFSMQRISYSGSVRGEFNAIKVVDIPAGEIPDQSSAVSGYWVAQGGYLDIPVHPRATEPEYVFTPGFSGCSLTVDQLNDNTLRVRHVEGSKEAEQYNRLPSAEHGMGMSAAMEFMDYGFDDEGGKVVTQLTGFAFMRYERKTRTWNIHYQSNQGAATIGVYSTERKLFGGSKSFASVMEKPKVRRTMTKQAVTVRARPQG